MTKRWASLVLALLTLLALTACTDDASSEESSTASVSAEATAEATAEQAQSSTVDGQETTEATMETQTTLAPIDMSAWEYNADDNVYYQIGIEYCAKPADPDYENLAVFVPGDYFTADDNGDGTYTCTINETAEVNGYTPATAPLVMPVNTPGYSAMRALTSYENVSDYMDAGFIYVHAGCRGRDSGAPTGVTDLKAAIRYLRYSAASLPADTQRVFVFGMSGGGAQSAILGASGDSPLYDVYLENIGAVEGESDAVLGAMCWCPITNLDTADAAYEWMMGNTRSGLSEEEQAISDALAAQYANDINAAGLKDADGNVLTLEESTDGIYQAGSYYDYIVGVIEDSLNQFLAETEFPYDASAASERGGPGGRTPGGDFGDFAPGGPDGDADGARPSRDGFGDRTGGPDGGPGGTPPDDLEGSGGAIEELDDISRTETTGGITLNGTYDSAQDYIDALNAQGTWVTYDPATNTASISSVADFTSALKNASKGLGAFDQLDRGQGENELFGTNGAGAHFDAALAEILADVESSYAADYAEDLQATDELGVSVEQRLNMYTPLYYLLEAEEGFGQSVVADYWRIRTGISQGDTSLTTEVNLALALENNEEVESVDFATVWGQKHTEAETSGSSAENFIQWVEECTRSAA